MVLPITRKRCFKNCYRSQKVKMKGNKRKKVRQRGKRIRQNSLLSSNHIVDVLNLTKKLLFFQLILQSNFSFGTSELPDDLPEDPSDPVSGLETSAVVEEVDEDSNPFIFQTKKTCSKDQLDYCAGSAYKSTTHTMCKYCVRTFFFLT
jgi:hypothetical protein